jgi:hypothetical protein
MLRFLKEYIRVVALIHNRFDAPSSHQSMAGPQHYQRQQVTMHMNAQTLHEQSPRQWKSNWPPSQCARNTSACVRGAGLRNRFDITVDIKIQRKTHSLQCGTLQSDLSCHNTC